jgi:hypothetical protein
MIDAVRYVVDNGVKWANLPCDFPPFKRVHAFARRWQIQGLLTELHDRLRDPVRHKEGRAADPSAVVDESGGIRGRVISAVPCPPSTCAGWPPRTCTPGTAGAPTGRQAMRGGGQRAVPCRRLR